MSLILLILFTKRLLLRELRIGLFISAKVSVQPGAFTFEVLE